MAARRLVIVLLVLFGISVIAAAIAPDRRGGLFDRSDGETSSATTREEPPMAAEPAAEALSVRITASVEDPETVEGFVGDQLELDVTSDRVLVLEIAEFGLTETAAPEAPANFDLLFRNPGRFAITDVDTDRIVGQLVVREPEDAKTDTKKKGST